MYFNFNAIYRITREERRASGHLNHGRKWRTQLRKRPFYNLLPCQRIFNFLFSAPTYPNVFASFAPFRTPPLRAFLDGGRLAALLPAKVGLRTVAVRLHCKISRFQGRRDRLKPISSGKPIPVTFPRHLTAARLRRFSFSFSVREIITPFLLQLRLTRN